MQYYVIEDIIVAPHCFQCLRISDEPTSAVRLVDDRQVRAWRVVAEYVVAGELRSGYVGMFVQDSDKSAKLQLGLILKNITINVD